MDTIALRSSCVADQRTALYRHFDNEGRLLYVGISLSVIARLRKHRERSAWFESIVRVEIQWLPDRQAALKAEASAIKNERPIHNATHGNRQWAADLACIVNSPAARLGRARQEFNESRAAWLSACALAEATQRPA